jgi:hypothetical protein
MAASTKRFILTDATYVDISEGATMVWFVLTFDPNENNAIRLALGQSLPAADTIHYQDINPLSFKVGNNDYPQEVPIRVDQLGAGDRVYVRAERDSAEVAVHRK